MCLCECVYVCVGMRVCMHACVCVCACVCAKHGGGESEGGWGEGDNREIVTFIYLFSRLCVTLFIVKHFRLLKSRHSGNLRLSLLLL